MGIWGHNLLDNDAALDIKNIWEKELKKYLNNYPNWEEKDIISFYLQNHFNNKFDYGERYNNLEILSLAKLLKINGYDLPKDFKNVVEIVVSMELQEDSLKEWEKPKKRKEILLTFLDEIEGKIKTVDEIKKKISILEFENKEMLLEKIKIWLKSEKLLEKEYPRFLAIVDKITRSQLGYEYDNFHIEVTSQRMMLLAFYVGWLLELPKEQTLELVKKAKKKVFL